ncbi:MAG: ABC transporter permease, partial [Chloroflexi bacterium]|nr:ABC transporter permease [Chloroflexota bacterium]
MRRFLMRRLIAVVPTILIVTGLVYALVLLVPGRDPAVFLLGDSADPALLERFHQELGLNDPIYVQYGHWLLNLAKGDLGRSIRTNERLTTEIRQRMGVTIELAVGSLAVALVIALPIGVWSAVRPNSLIDNVGTVFAIAGAAIPNFWLGILLIYLFAVSLGWLPAEGYVRLTNDPLDNLKHMIMPMVTAGTAAAATITRQTRAAVMEVLRQDYIRTARAKGLSQRLVITRHALKNSLIPVVTVLG